jgi:hypothetical protein
MHQHSCQSSFHIRSSSFFIAKCPCRFLVISPSWRTKRSDPQYDVFAPLLSTACFPSRISLAETILLVFGVGFVVETTDTAADTNNTCCNDDSYNKKEETRKSTRREVTIMIMMIPATTLPPSTEPKDHGRPSCNRRFAEKPSNRQRMYAIKRTIQRHTSDNDVSATSSVRDRDHVVNDAGFSLPERIDAAMAQQYEHSVIHPPTNP